MLTRAPAPFPATLDDERRLDRRRFLCAAGAAAGAVVLGEALGRRLAADRAAHAPAVDAAALASLAPGESRAVTTPDADVLAVRLADGTVVAFDRRCPHLGCPVVWAPEHARFECPCHHAAFDARTGAVITGPPRRGLTPAEVRA